MQFAPPFLKRTFPNPYVNLVSLPISRRHWPVLAPPFINGWIRQWVIKGYILPISTFFDKLAHNSGTREAAAPQKKRI